MPAGHPPLEGVGRLAAAQSPQPESIPASSTLGGARKFSLLGRAEQECPGLRSTACPIASIKAFASASMLGSTDAGPPAYVLASASNCPLLALKAVRNAFGFG